jgi:hypothetical protein
MFSTPTPNARRDLLSVHDLPPLSEEASDYGSVDMGLSENEVLSPRLIDFDAYRTTGVLAAPVAHPGAERPVVQWKLFAGLVGLATIGAGLMTAVGLGLVGLLWLY